MTEGIYQSFVCPGFGLGASYPWSATSFTRTLRRGPGRWSETRSVTETQHLSRRRRWNYFEMDTGTETQWRKHESEDSPSQDGRLRFRVRGQDL